MVDTLSALRQNTNAGQATSNANASTTGENNVALKSLANNFDNFLKILTSQLQNQDPMDPLDSSEFTNQLVLFAGVEQDIAQNTNLEKMTKLLQDNNALLDSAVPYIGKNIEAKGNQIQHTQSQSSTLVYDLPKTAKTATIRITDAAGKLVREVTGGTTIGRNEFSWDGKNAAGADAATAVYRYSVQAKDANDAVIKDVTTYTLGKVAGVKNDLATNNVSLELGNKISVALKDVTSVK